MASPPLIERILRWLPFAATGASTLRAYPEGTLKSLRRHLATLTLDDLRGFVVSDEAEFQSHLNHHTLEMQVHVQGNWGAARKVLNIYLRNVLYNHYSREAVRFDACERFLEVPLDRLLGTAIRKAARATPLPPWPTLGRLTSEVSAQYQSAASIIAGEMALSRVHLDLYLGPDVLPT